MKIRGLIKMINECGWELVDNFWRVPEWTTEG